jgi:hypothetical protein
MRLVPGAVGVLLLLALLTWLLLRATDTNAPAHAATLQAFDDFAIAEGLSRPRPLAGACRPAS